MDTEKISCSKTVRSKLFSEEKHSSLLCVFELPDGLDARLTSCLQKCTENCEQYCREHILPRCAENGSYVYRLRVVASPDKGGLLLSIKATLTDRRACKVLLSERKDFKYKSPA